MNEPKPCMGGFCHLREKCSHHEAGNRTETPAERLCAPGLEKEMFFAVVADKSTLKQEHKEI